MEVDGLIAAGVSAPKLEASADGGLPNAAGITEPKQSIRQHSLNSNTLFDCTNLGFIDRLDRV